MLLVGKTSLVKALMSPSSCCAAIHIDDRTIAIDTYDMQLPPSSVGEDDDATTNIDDGSDGCSDSEGSVSMFSDNHQGISNISLGMSIDPVFDVKLWDLGGQDVCMLSHTVHFTHRCVYMLLWRPLESIHDILSLLFLWLESLCIHVPDAHIVLVGSHCKSISTERIAELSAKIETAARFKLQELNEKIRLDVDNLRSQLLHAINHRQLLQDTYEKAAAGSSDDAEFLLHYGQANGAKELFAARKEASLPSSSQERLASIHPPLVLPPLRRSLRSCAAEVHQALVNEELIRARLQRLLGIRTGASPDDRAACQMSLHCTNVDSVDGHGIRELRFWIYNHCRLLPFMGEMISSNWIAIADVFKYFGDSVLSQSDAVALTRRHLPPLKYNLNVCDDEIWSVIEFWSLVGRIFVHESQVVRDPSTLIALLKPLLHHQPLQMMRLPVYQSLLVEASLQRADTRVELSSLLNRLDNHDELTLPLLDHLSAWKVLSFELRSSMLGFFESSHLLCRISERPDARLIASRVRAKPPLTYVDLRSGQSHVWRCVSRVVPAAAEPHLPHRSLAFNDVQLQA
jgi:GTPase SAR1 family protein